MIDKALVDGIKQHLAEGDSPETVRDYVLRQGYTEEQYELALNQAQAELSGTPTTPDQSTPAQSSVEPIFPRSNSEALARAAGSQKGIFFWVLIGLSVVAFFCIVAYLTLYFQGGSQDITLFESSSGACLSDDPEVRALQKRFKEIRKEEAELSSGAIEVLGLVQQAHLTGDYDKYEPMLEGYEEVTDQYAVVIASYYDTLESLQKSQASEHFRSEMNDVYEKYCEVSDPVIVPTSIDVSRETLTELDYQTPAESLCRLQSGEVSIEKTPEILARLNTSPSEILGVQNMDFITCAAERYYSPSAMLFLAIKHFPVSMEELERNATPAQIELAEPDVEKAYFWMMAHYWLSIILDSPYADRGDSMHGYFTSLMLAAAQQAPEFQLSRAQREQIENEAIEFLANRFPEIKVHEMRLYDRGPLSFTRAFDDILSKQPNEIVVKEMFAAMQEETKIFRKDVGPYTKLCDDLLINNIYAEFEQDWPSSLYCYSDEDNFVFSIPMSDGWFYCMDKDTSGMRTGGYPQRLSCG